MISCHYLNKLSKVQAYLHTFKALLKVCRSKHIIKCHTIYINISLNVTYIKKFKNMHVCMYVCTSLFSVIFLHYTFENIFTYLLRHYAYRVTLYLLLRFPVSILGNYSNFLDYFFDYFIRLDAWALHILISCDLSIFSRVYYLWDRIRRSIR